MSSIMASHLHGLFQMNLLILRTNYYSYLHATHIDMTPFALQTHRTIKKDC
jgi:hypothetical protein